MAAARIVLLSTLHASHAARSGYPLLAEYLPGTTFLTARRQDPQARLPRLGAQVARRLAFSRWYLGGSAALEWQGYRYLRDRDPSIVHFLWADFDLGFLDYYLQARGDHLCGTFHHCDDTIASVIRFPQRLRRFAAVILMSATQRPFMLQAGVRPERIHVVPHGVDTNYFTPQSLRLDEPFVILAVGGYRRNFTLLRQVCDALRDVPGVRFCVVVPAAARAVFAGCSNVEVCSGLSDQELLRRYQGASCFLMTADNATANNAMLEAMSCGLPIVAEAVGGVPEYVDDAAALLVAPRDVTALAQALRTLIQSPQRRQEMALAARARALGFDWSQVAEATQQIYDSLPGGSRDNQPRGRTRTPLVQEVLP